MQSGGQVGCNFALRLLAIADLRNQGWRRFCLAHSGHWGRLNISSIATISTSHLTQQVAQILTAKRDNTPWITAAEWAHGYFLNLDELPENTPQCIAVIDRFEGRSLQGN